MTVTNKARSGGADGPMEDGMSDPVFDYMLEAGGGTGRWLLSRLKDAEPTDPWKRIARFESYNDAEWVLRQLMGER